MWFVISTVLLKLKNIPGHKQCLQTILHVTTQNNDNQLPKKLIKHITVVLAQQCLLSVVQYVCLSKNTEE